MTDTQIDLDALIEFLLARIAEDEAVALRITPGRNPEHGNWRADSLEFSGVHDREMTRHIVRHDPARVLAECGAKRRIVESARHTLFDDPLRRTDFWRGARDVAEADLCFLALPYADHPDYRQEWRP